MSTTSEALKTAVQQQPVSSAKGFQQRLFRAWFNSFIYNQIWEDPALDMKALDLQPDSQVLTIASGGCNVLNYLTASPARIVAIDLNPYHLSLTRLKLSAMEHLPNHAAFYDFFGYANLKHNVEHFQRYIKPELDEETVRFWESRSVTGKKRIQMFRNDLYRQTRFGLFMRFLHWIARHSKYQPERILQAKSPEEQREIFDAHIKPFFDSKLVKLLGRLPMSVFSLGIPPQQYEAMKAQGNLIQQYCERVERLACQFPIQDNYFAWQGFSHRYDHQHRKAIPDYLQACHYEKIREQLHKVETHEGSMIEYLKQQPAQSLDRFVFLDAQDWMSDDVLVALWQEVARVAKPNSRIIFRTAASESPLEQVLPAALRARFHYDPVQSEQWFQQDRSAIYGGFHMYQKVG